MKITILKFSSFTLAELKQGNKEMINTAIQYKMISISLISGSMVASGM